MRCSGREVLLLALLLAVGGCLALEPAACARNSDCGIGLVCGADGWCAKPPDIDAGVIDADGAVDDASSEPDGGAEPDPGAEADGGAEPPESESEPEPDAGPPPDSDPEPGSESEPSGPADRPRLDPDRPLTREPRP